MIFDIHNINHTLFFLMSDLSFLRKGVKLGIGAREIRMPKKEKEEGMDLGTTPKSTNLWGRKKRRRNYPLGEVEERECMS